MLCEGVAETGLDILDFAIVLLVCAGSINRLKDTPVLRRHHHGSDAPVPAELMTPTSMGAIEECLKLDAATARARLDALVETEILSRSGDGFIMGRHANASEAAERLADKNVALARRFAKQMTSTLAAT